MNTRLIKKQLGAILIKYLLVPRMTNPTKIAKATATNRIKYNLLNTNENKNYRILSHVNFHGTKQSYIFKKPHIMHYQTDSTPNSRVNYRKGDVRMKHISNMNEFKTWYCHIDNPFAKDAQPNLQNCNLIKVLQQAAQSLRARYTESVADNNNQDNSDNQPSDDDGNDNN